MTLCSGSHTLRIARSKWGLFDHSPARVSTLVRGQVDRSTLELQMVEVAWSYVQSVPQSVALVVADSSDGLVGAVLRDDSVFPCIVVDWGAERVVVDSVMNAVAGARQTPVRPKTGGVPKPPATILLSLFPSVLWDFDSLDERRCGALFLRVVVAAVFPIQVTPDPRCSCDSRRRGVNCHVCRGRRVSSFSPSGLSFLSSWALFLLAISPMAAVDVS